jgi:A/G-specific adenine glycosylase
VFARWLAWRGDLKASATQSRLWEAASRLVPDDDPGTFNQAFMELGALVCTPREPACLVCPVAAECRARALGLQDALPVAVPRAAPLPSAEAAALVTRGGKVLLVRRGPGRLWDGFWEFPTAHVSGADPAGRAFADGPVGLAEAVRRLTGVQAEVGGAVHALSYGVTRYRVRLEAYEARGLTDGLAPGPGFREAAWVDPGRLSDHTFSSPGRKLAAWVARLASPGG